MQDFGLFFFVFVLQASKVKSFATFSSTPDQILANSSGKPTGILKLNFQMPTGKVIELHEFLELDTQILTDKSSDISQHTTFEKIHFLKQLFQIGTKLF